MKALFVSYERTLYFSSIGKSEKSLDDEIIDWARPISTQADIAELRSYLKTNTNGCIAIKIINWRRME